MLGGVAPGPPLGNGGAWTPAPAAPVARSCAPSPSGRPWPGGSAGGPPRRPVSASATPRRPGSGSSTPTRAPSPPAALLRADRGRRGGGRHLLRREHLQHAPRSRRVVQQLRKAHAQSPVAPPLLLMTDQEGGLVRRLPGAPDAVREAGRRRRATRSPRPPRRAPAPGRTSPQRRDERQPRPGARRVPHGGRLHRPVRALLQQGPRRRAPTCGAAFIRAQQATGVAATAKHFPGLGAASSGRTPTSARSPSTCRCPTCAAVDEVALPAAIAAGVKLVMLSWAVYPALDAALPAGLSPRSCRASCAAGSASRASRSPTRWRRAR